MTEISSFRETPQTLPEIERQFVVTSLPPEITSKIERAEAEGTGYTDIEQGYLPNKGARIRKKIAPDGSIVGYEWAEKTKHEETGNVLRDETQADLTEEEFNGLWPLTVGRRVSKRRFDIPLGDLNIELDAFKHNLAGHMLAEIEFPTLKRATEFAPLPWFRRDVTKEFSNRKLAKGEPFPQP